MTILLALTLALGSLEDQIDALLEPLGDDDPAVRLEAERDLVKLIGSDPARGRAHLRSLEPRIRDPHVRSTLAQVLRRFPTLRLVVTVLDEPADSNQLRVRIAIRNEGDIDRTLDDLESGLLVHSGEQQILLFPHSARAQWDGQWGINQQKQQQLRWDSRSYVPELPRVTRVIPAGGTVPLFDHPVVLPWLPEKPGRYELTIDAHRAAVPPRIGAARFTVETR